MAGDSRRVFWIRDLTRLDGFEEGVPVPAPGKGVAARERGRKRTERTREKEKWKWRRMQVWIKGEGCRE